MTRHALRKAAFTLYPKWGAQTRLAEALRLDISTVRNYFSGKRTIPGIVEVAVILLLREKQRRQGRKAS